MAQHHVGEKCTPDHSGEDEIHLPSPTLAPPVVGLGVVLLSFGILYGTALLLLGAVFMVLGIAIWLINDAREFVKAGDHGSHGGH
ncbi:MAG: hypothetical protein HYY42_05615 [Chloroflexi bacterium]|nr:hypothetical protein [Chloroflexota bacterium]